MSATEIPQWVFALLNELKEAGLMRYEFIYEGGRNFLEYQLYDVEQSLRNTFCTGDDAACFRVERRDGELWISYDSARGSEATTTETEDEP